MVEVEEKVEEVVTIKVVHPLEELNVSVVVVVEIVKEVVVVMTVNPPEDYELYILKVAIVLNI